jgi:hypothetical protein
MMPSCQVCGKKVHQYAEPWIYAIRDVAGQDSLCYIHYYCANEGLIKGSIKKLVTEHPGRK